MELPTVLKDETRRDFADRCMKDTDMNTEFPNEAERLDAITEIYDYVCTDELVAELNRLTEE